jgi:transcriptional regulator with XRE-family HTH domain
VTAGQLIRSARLRAGLTQAELGRRLSMPRSQIARWELEEVEPALATVRRVLRACGFDLSMALVAYEPDRDREARLRELQRLTPQERLRRMLEGDSRR